eukprot:CAMPEP_0113515188 /NCGR_PEP_ID=MMETSP0014_2-20120614/40808_1 /TAXON_ID=2857 /ORGANISM="Nitzschia sp." /LENGTH=232 /DNA_ID=CAMNT_0000411733 /DNA_START=1227 /DNA_END=1925 /DNA_ORIENTATION=- /assembly_acc=CAM_ASM_000159
MQLLVPLEDDGKGVCNDASEALPLGREASPKGRGTDEGDKNQENNPSSSSSVMSENLRNQFEAMKTVIRQVKRAESQEMLSSDANHDDTTKAGDGSNSSIAKKSSEKDLSPRDAVASTGDADAENENKSNNTQELKRKAEQLAFEIAAAVDEEISRWRNSIADLEALLAEEELDDDYHEGQPDEQESDTQVRRHARPLPPPLQQVDVPRFPALARVIPDDTDDDDAVDDNVQ